MRKKIIFYILFGFFLELSSFSQTYVVQIKPAGSEEWGYININGERIIEPKYRVCYEFSEGGLVLYITPKESLLFS
jgi:hypothetical protein